MNENQPTKNPYDLKQMGIGGGSVLAVLFLFQSQGIEIMNKSNDTAYQANKERIEKLETEIGKINDKIDREFSTLRDQIRIEVTRITDLMRVQTQDRWTRTDHHNYQKRMENELNSIKKRIEKLESGKK